MIYILIMIFSGHSHGSTSIQVEFNNQAQCEVAKAHILKQRRSQNPPIYYGCYPKGLK